MKNKELTSEYLTRFTLVDHKTGKLEYSGTIEIDGIDTEHIYCAFCGKAYLYKGWLNNHSNKKHPEIMKALEQSDSYKVRISRIQ